MFIMDSGVDRPDLEHFHDYMRNSMKEGIAVRNFSKVAEAVRKEKEAITSILKSNYGINSPTNPASILEYYQNELYRYLLDQVEEDIVLRGDAKGYIETMGKDRIMRVLEELASGDSGRLNSFLDLALPSEAVNLRKRMEELFNDVACSEIISAMYRDGKWTTDKESRMRLMDMGNVAAKDIHKFKEYKSYETAIKQIQTALNKEGRFCPTVSIGKTNRINCSNPPLMGIPKNILWDIIGPRKADNILVSVDIKNQEPWIMVNILEIERLRNIREIARQLEWGTQDLYTCVFHDIFGYNCNAVERMELKTSWNAMTYGASKRGISYICKLIDYKEVYGYFMKFPEYREYRAKVARLAKLGVSSMKTYFGSTVNAETSGKGLNRVLMDIPIQGTGSDVQALLLENFERETVERGIDDKMSIYFTRHDEDILEIDREYFEEVGEASVIETLEDIFEHRIDDWDPFEVHIKILEPNFSIESSELNELDE